MTSARAEVSDGVRYCVVGRPTQQAVAAPARHPGDRCDRPWRNQWSSLARLGPRRATVRREEHAATGGEALRDGQSAAAPKET